MIGDRESIHGIERHGAFRRIAEGLAFAAEKTGPRPGRDSAR